jgi:hypothetical protein
VNYSSFHDRDDGSDDGGYEYFDVAEVGSDFY